MDLENLKQVWNEEKIESVPEISLEKQKEIHTPLEMIRKNMRAEFWISVVSFSLWAMMLPVMGKNTEQTYLLVILVFIALTITGYYYLKFYVFYKKLNTKNLNTYHNILDLRYELVLNSELYKSFNIVFVPIMLGLYSTLYLHNKESNIIFFIILFLTFCVILYFIGKYWMYESYGKHIMKISKIVAEIKDEEDGFEYDRSFLKIQKELDFLQKASDFCNEKFKKYGQTAYIIFLIISLLLISLLIGACIGILYVISKHYNH